MAFQQLDFAPRFLGDPIEVDALKGVLGEMLGDQKRLNTDGKVMLYM
jgi:hypothetical protein